MPAVLIEAGLCGVPAVSTHVGAIADVIVDGVTGRVVARDEPEAFARAVDEVVRAPEARLGFGSAARKRCLERFTIDAVAPSWLDYLVTVGERRGRRVNHGFSG